MKRLFGLLSIVLVWIASERSALASDAGKLFEDGVKLLDAGDYAAACPKLEESQRLEPAAGTLLNLAGLDERRGRRALALKTFREAARAARERGRADWEKVAEQHVRDLTAVLPTLTIARGAASAHVEVTVDGERLQDEDFGAPRIVDPGSHTITVRAPGKKPHASIITIKRATEWTVPALEMERASEPEPSAPPPSGGLVTRQVAGLAAMGVGAASILLGGIGVIVASSALDEAKSRCPEYPSRCSPEAQNPNDRAETWSSIATVSLVAGTAVAGVGAVLFLWPSSGANVRVGFDGSRVVAAGRF